MGGETRSRGPWLATVLSLLGIGVVGAGLAYSLHIASELGSVRRDAAPAVSSGVPVNQKVSGVAITPGREVIGAILSIDASALTVSSAPGGNTVDLRTDENTQVTTTHGSKLTDLKVGDVVIIQVSADGETALAIYAGQISVAGTPSVG
ncbi:hypothetical protein TPAU25S_02397 [Tsukamurella paurometabola]|uniref:DUF5666 domain-containing protein n=1 Tax=Tsukamurella paurometabola (strain ATCC 8368 / DSM 20162 / CCUG 35730 / CIP 100753 / JCM 10117 / KCTC 9821 / NBRC 16120 / NCIMB 702349 / NCTC 13040) TaxID=521096 RepID=D5US75_TSUPD|nr:hypothetical protein [Tsukamurella paurometabola]ADG77142.1 hypothetical protein Tpau_0501 [Tsukamurella paurometabola DSM 20162]SUP42927.1 Uncharacterised protein [Tsukamurella paurometabola]